jgi:hypothetical protein
MFLVSGSNIHILSPPGKNVKGFDARSQGAAFEGIAKKDIGAGVFYIYD